MQVQSIDGKCAPYTRPSYDTLCCNMNFDAIWSGTFSEALEN